MWSKSGYPQCYPGITSFWHEKGALGALFNCQLLQVSESLYNKITYFLIFFSNLVTFLVFKDINNLNISVIVSSRKTANHCNNSLFPQLMGFIKNRWSKAEHVRDHLAKWTNLNMSTTRNLPRNTSSKNFVTKCSWPGKMIYNYHKLTQRHSFLAAFLCFT